jgi:hypothetical protein
MTCEPNIGFLPVATAIRQQIQSLLCADVTKLTQAHLVRTNRKHSIQQGNIPSPWLDEQRLPLKVMSNYLFNKQADLFIKAISLFTFQEKNNFNGQVIQTRDVRSKSPFAQKPFLDTNNSCAIFWDIASCSPCVNLRFGENMKSIFRIENQPRHLLHFIFYFFIVSDKMCKDSPNNGSVKRQ